MENLKPFIVAAVFSLVGIVFIVAGIHFLSKKYLDILSQYRRATGRVSRDNSRMLGKTCGFFSIGTGVLTIVCGILMAVKPDVLMNVALIYLAALFIGTVCILFVIRAVNGR